MSALKVIATAADPLLDQCPDPVFKTDRDGRLQYSNSASIAVFDAWELENAEQLPQDIVEILQYTLANEIPCQLDVEVDSQLFELRIVPAEDAQFVHFYGRDVSNQRQALQERLNSELRLQQVVHGARLGLWDWYPQSESVTVIGEYFSMLGYDDRPPGDYHHSVFFESLHPEDRPRVQAAVWGNHHRNTDYCVELRLRCADESYKWILSSGRVTERDHAGQVVRMSGLHMDISGRKEAEFERQRLNQELLKSAREAGMAEIATGVLHNIGNVLNSVQVSTNLLQEQTRESKIGRVSDVGRLIELHRESLAEFLINDPRGARVPDYLIKLGQQLDQEQQILKEEFESLTQHLDHMKSVIAMQQSIAKTSGLIELCRIDEVIEEAVNFHKKLTDRYGIEVQLDLERLPVVQLDKQKVMQILVNLLKNAREAVLHEQAQAERIEVSLRETEQRTFVVRVRDTGVGISTEMQDRIFNHGFTTKSGGHGFGLHSCANFAKQMGGELRVSSPGVGCGATFTLELPLCYPEVNDSEIDW